jgi:hypothetical protein
VLFPEVDTSLRRGFAQLESNSWVDYRMGRELIRVSNPARFPQRGEPMKDRWEERLLLFGVVVLLMVAIAQRFF